MKTTNSDQVRIEKDNEIRERSILHGHSAMLRVLNTRCPKHDAHSGQGCFVVPGSRSREKYHGACSARIAAAGYPLDYPSYRRDQRHAA